MTFKINIKKYIWLLNIKPLSDRVLIEPVAAEQKLLQGFIPDTAKENHKRNCCC
jgi:co-chaperonin GroES (HSP10)